MSFPRILFALCALLAAAPPVGSVGKYTRRQAARGEVTDTAPKLDRYAFVNDAAPEPRQLVLIADTWVARAPHDSRFLPLVIALSYEGAGKPLPIRPDRFELSWDDSPPVKALAQRELVAAAGDRGSPVWQDVRRWSRRQRLAFDTPNADYISVQFHSHPALRGLVHDRLMLPARRWFETLAYFPMPEGFDAWDSLFELRYVPEDGAPPGVTCRFRVQRDPALQQEAMRKARKDLARENEPER